MTIASLTLGPVSAGVRTDCSTQARAFRSGSQTMGAGGISMRATQTTTLIKDSGEGLTDMLVHLGVTP